LPAPKLLRIATVEILSTQPNRLAKCRESPGSSAPSEAQHATVQHFPR